MKRQLIFGLMASVLIVALLLVFSTAFASDRYTNQYGVRTIMGYGQVSTYNHHLSPYFLYFANRDSTVKFYVDSAGAVYPAYPSGSTTNFSPTTVGTLTLGTSTLYWKSLYAAVIFNKTTAFLDSSGNVSVAGTLISTGDSSRFQGPVLVNDKITATDSAWIKGPTQITGTFGATGNATLGGTLSLTGKGVLSDSARVQGNLKVNGLFMGGGVVAKIDSGTAASQGTWAIDTISWTGARAGDIALITEMTPLYSVTPDTGAHTTARVGTDAVYLYRTLVAAGHTLKTWPIFSVALISKQ